MAASSAIRVVRSGCRGVIDAKLCNALLLVSATDRWGDVDNEGAGCSQGQRERGRRLSSNPMEPSGGAGAIAGYRGAVAAAFSIIARFGGLVVGYGDHPRSLLSGKSSRGRIGREEVVCRGASPDDARLGTF